MSDWLLPLGAVTALILLKGQQWRPLLQSQISNIDNSLEYLRTKGLGPHYTAVYVMCKRFLNMLIPNEQEIIDFLDGQQESDGAWTDVWTRMFTTHRVLLAYYLLGAKPETSLNPFFSEYDTWEKAKYYISDIIKTDWRDIYHITTGWCLYWIVGNHTLPSSYPPWINNFFIEVEKEPYLTQWTTGTDFHRRTHILYTYVIKRQSFPNLDGIINETLREQMEDGSWYGPSGPVYHTHIQVTLLSQILKLYPNYRNNEILNSIFKTRNWLYNNYHTEVSNGKTYGYFGDKSFDELWTGIMCATQNGLIKGNIDMTFQDIVNKLG